MTKRKLTLRGLIACVDRHSAQGWALMMLIYVAWIVLKTWGH